MLRRICSTSLGRLVSARAVRVSALGIALAACVTACGGGEEAAAPPDEDRAVVTTSEPEPRVLGGSPAPRGQWPFAAFVATYVDRDFDGRPDDLTRPPDGVPDRLECGGSLIGERWVLTAAHCVWAPLDSRIWVGREERPWASPNPYVASGEQRDVWVHPDWSPRTFANDVALVRLDRPAPQRAVPFVLADDDDLWKAGSLATIIGWGLTSEDGDPSDLLRQAQVPIVADGSCATSYPRRPNRTEFLAATMFCAGRPEGGVDTCQGDSGGPILVPSGEQWLQAGVVSWGEGCGRAGFPGVYARLETLAESILAALRQDPESAIELPAGQTGDPVEVGDVSATVSGTVRAGGLATFAAFQLRPADSSTYTQAASAYVGAGQGSLDLEVVFRGLEPGTTYAYRVLAVSSGGGVVPGLEKTFTTSG